MATVVIYIDPTAGGSYDDGDGSLGNPYRSLYYAQGQRIPTFNAGSDNYEFRCKTGEDLNGNGTSGVSFSINATSATPRTILITVDSSSDQHTGVRDTGYRFPAPLRISNNNTNVTINMVGIAAQNFSAEGITGVVFNASNCISFDTPNEDASIYTGGGTAKWINCAAVGGTFSGFYQENNISTPTVTYINCTSIGNASSGFQRASGGATLINCYSGGNTVAPYTGTMTRTNCMHDTAAVFSGSIASTAYTTANFINVTASTQNAKLVSGSALIAAGVGPASNPNVPTTDFEGTLRAGTTTDVGFDQFLAPDVTPTPTVTVTATSGITPTPTHTLTPTITNTPSGTLAPTPTATLTPTSTVTPSQQLHVQVYQKLINLADSAVTSLSGITAIVYKSIPTIESPDPWQVIEDLTTNSSGYVNFTVDSTGFSYGDSIWVVFMKDGSPAKGGLRRIIPYYSGPGVTPTQTSTVTPTPTLTPTH